MERERERFFFFSPGTQTLKPRTFVDTKTSRHLAHHLSLTSLTYLKKKRRKKERNDDDDEKKEFLSRDARDDDDDDAGIVVSDEHHHESVALVGGRGFDCRSGARGETIFYVGNDLLY